MLSGFEGYDATLDDYLLQANLCFPDVRLRNFVELRNHDCGNRQTPYAILAIYKGILYNPIAMDEVLELFNGAKFSDFSELRYNVPKTALNAKFRNYFVKDYAKEILYIAEKSLIEQNCGDEKYLDFIKEYTLNGLTPADIIIKNWYGLWNKNIDKLIDFVS